MQENGLLKSRSSKKQHKTSKAQHIKSFTATAVKHNDSCALISKIHTLVINMKGKII